MKIFKNSILGRLTALVRCAVLKSVSSKNIKTNGFFFIGKGNKIFAVDKGTINLGKRVRLADFTELQSSGYLSIGSGTTINNYSRIVAFERIIIGSGCAIASFVTILDHDHDYIYRDGSLRFNGYETSPIQIGSNVWIGDKCTILKGVTIGDNVVIGANSVVSRDMPSNCIIVGNPARVLRRFNDSAPQEANQLG